MAVEDELRLAASRGDGSGPIVGVERIKPRIRVPVRSRRMATGDSFQNTIALTGADPGSGNQATGAHYGFNPISRYRTELEFAYRGSWVVRVAVDCVADDMTRAGIELGAGLPPDEGNKIFRKMITIGAWSALNKGLKWSRLYGGAMVVPIIDGQDVSTPLEVDKIGRNQFKGLLVLDRWMVQPALTDLIGIKDLNRGADPRDIGLPRYYDVGVGLQGVGAPFSGMRVHHSRALRFDGLDLPFFQFISENYWGLSVVEPLWDRLIAFDSTTQGAAQLVYKAHLRVWKMAGLDELFGENRAAAEKVLKRVSQVARFQSNEGLTLIDSEDEIEMNSYAFGGLSDLMLQFGQQLAGSLQVPLTRLFGQAPAGLNSTGESDMRNYEDGILQKQELRLRRPVDVILRCCARSEGVPLEDGFWWDFKALRQLTDEQKGELADRTTGAVTAALESQVISKRIAAKELQQSSRRTGIFTNIDDDYLDKLDEEPPVTEMMSEMGGEGEASGIPRTPGVHAPHLGAVGAGGEREEESGDAVPGAGILPSAQPAPRPRPQFHLHIGDASRILEVQGLPIYIETFAGQERVGLRGWATKMPAAYGFIRMTGSAEGAGEGFDCFIGEDLEAETVYVINQVDPETGIFDEHKAAIGFPSRTLALRAYQRAFSDGSGAARVGSVRSFHMSEFKRFLESGDMRRAA